MYHQIGTQIHSYVVIKSGPFDIKDVADTTVCFDPLSILVLHLKYCRHVEQIIFPEVAIESMRGD